MPLLGNGCACASILRSAVRTNKMITLQGFLRIVLHSYAAVRRLVDSLHMDVNIHEQFMPPCITSEEGAPGIG